MSRKNDFFVFPKRGEVIENMIKTIAEPHPGSPTKSGFPRSLSLPQMNPPISLEPPSTSFVSKLKIQPQDSNGSLQGILKDSGYDGNSGSYCGDLMDDVELVINSGVIMPADFPSAGSNSGVMLASEPQSEAGPQSPAVSTIRVPNKEPKKNQIVEGVIVSSKNGRQLLLDPFDKKLKDLRTLKQHYYPEGGWGWVILFVTLTVQILVVGLQFGLATYALSTVPFNSHLFVKRLFVHSSPNDADHAGTVLFPSSPPLTSI